MLEWTQEGVLQKLPYRCIQRFKESVNSRKLEWTQEGVLQKLPYRCIQRFKESVNSRKSVNRKFCDELLLEKVKCILYEKGG